VPLLEEPKRGSVLTALGIARDAWVVVDLRQSDDVELLYDVWVEPRDASGTRGARRPSPD
jgi:hypothetical protein